MGATAEDAGHGFSMSGLQEPPVFLDFEASSLASASYPIEVAWSRPDGMIESHLISPAGIEHWTDWSAQAERLHGISRARLLAEGKAPGWICRRLNEQLAGRVVYTDAPEYDQAWLEELFSACWAGTPSFTLASADELLLGMLTPRCASREDAARELAAIKDEARRRLPGRHRAGWDVEPLDSVTEPTPVVAGAASGGVGCGVSFKIMAHPE